MMRKFLYYNKYLLKEWLFIVLLLFGLLNTILKIFLDLDIPDWAIAAVFFIAIYFAGFKIWGKGFADINLAFHKNQDIVFSPHGDGENIDTPQVSVIHGHFSNFGPQTSAVRSATLGISAINGIEDPFVLNRLSIQIENTPLLEGKVPNWWYNEIDTSTNAVDFPLVLETNTLYPCFFQLKFTCSILNPDIIVATFKWLKSITIEITFNVDRANKLQEKRCTVTIPTRYEAV